MKEESEDGYRWIDHSRFFVRIIICFVVIFRSGCDCQEGYSGPHCEYLDESGLSSLSSLSSSSGGGKGNVAFASTIVVVVVVLALVGVVLGRRYHKRRQTEYRERQVVERTLLNNTSGRNNNNDNKDNVLIDLGPQRDFDGNELEEVEIV